jgi:hypothetical protein
VQANESSKHDFGNERPGLDIAAAFQLEDVTLGTEHGAAAQPFHD